MRILGGEGYIISSQKNKYKVPKGVWCVPGLAEEAVYLKSHSHGFK